MQKTSSHIKQYWSWYLLLVLIISAFVLYSVVKHENRKGVLTFAVLDVGQGDALYIESPNGTQVIVDGGPGKALMREINKVVPWYDRNIDMIVVTNPDKDHYEGFIPLIKKYSVRSAMFSGTESVTDEFSYLKKVIVDRGIETLIAVRGQKIDIGSGAYLEIFFPDRDVSGLSPNDGSIIMRLVYGETSVLLTGDTTARIEEFILGLDSVRLKSTIFKLAHHGSKTSNTEDFLNAVDPEWIVISSGLNNSYGHPHKEVVETFENQNVPTYNTCNNGRIVFESDGKTFSLKNKNLKEAVPGCKV